MHMQHSPSMSWPMMCHHLWCFTFNIDSCLCSCLCVGIKFINDWYHWLPLHVFAKRVMHMVQSCMSSPSWLLDVFSFADASLLLMALIAACFAVHSHTVIVDRLNASWHHELCSKTRCFAAILSGWWYAEEIADENYVTPTLLLCFSQVKLTKALVDLT